jgi:signal transduction histidine kinase
LNSQVEPATKGWEIGDVFDAALQTLINDRCRQSYIHEMRGGLQAIHSSFELLVRTAKQGGVSGALIEHAAALAKRAMAGHERIMLEIVDQLTVPEGEPAIVNMTILIDEVQRFLRNDASRRNVRISVAGDKNLQVATPINKLRTLLLGLLTYSIDTLPVGAELKIDVSRAREDACVSFSSELSFDEIGSAEALLRDETRWVQPRDLILAYMQRWLQKHGGRVVSNPGAGVHHDLRIYYPLYAE